jgi:ADP-ribosylglycohydrolase
MCSFVRVCSRITHTDPRAEYGALAVALAAAGRLGEFGDVCPDHEFVARVLGMELDPGDGISGYMYDTVPAAIALAARHAGDYRSAILAAIRCGGDTDTVAAIAGAIVGAQVGERGIPREWVEGIWDWPRGVAGLRRLAAGDVPRVSYLGSIWRNAMFFGVALVHVVGTIRGR